ncbi:P-loop containing nucleoside triphosphate hydrolase protein [Aspergillus heteromorphus CBS 117.55]|uniref:P-loop containing nucleoside triphosphate hydrolase protein n=1 Tax=Aspergillus heteromorphus CBS 117.55 TaxID=1448321 RepID=A0A317VQ94_9EURO|nr:P-loop containing nucleoside triphosphate hydrolase protein [Aspergillus heteromorphus CBS 117.55]PWY75451.1 P-loop containing nucleoside triphosphate hydrolase protein [Aspergillus heteromorphus CBS 117.55]
MITSSLETRRAFVEDLATESGLQNIRLIVETDFATSYSVLKPTFDPHCLLFLRMISHQEILSSLVLEKAVGTIYNVIYGPGGRRGMDFLTNVTRYLVETNGGSVSEENTKVKGDAATNGSTKASAPWAEALLLTTKVLLSTLNLNQEAAAHPDLKHIIESLCSCCQKESATADANIDLARANIINIGDSLSIGDSLYISKVTEKVKKTNPKKIEEMPVDFPGELSERGPRHDNDHAAIPRIRILPTISEILSDARAEFLPSQGSLDPSSHHERGVCRLIDTHFRLLREDTSGVVRDALRLIIHNWDFLAHSSDWKLKHKFLRQYSPTPLRIFSGVQMRQINADQKKGIEIDLEFDQLHRLKNMSALRRKQWWLDTRTLRGGPLLALLDAEDLDNAYAMFFLVSKREVNHIEKKRNASPTPISDVVSDAERAMITLRLADSAYESDANRLLSMMREKPARPLILIEFPAVPYNSFEGILRCLQSLHKSPWRVPFATWLAPSGVSDELIEALTTSCTKNINVPPPVYLQGRVVNLSSLPRRNLDNGDPAIPILMSPFEDNHSITARLSQETILDEGQAAAMVSALRCKLALIQGPPGTGKSYVGLQIARCLLDNQESLQLGPILCVCYTAHALDQFLDGLVKSGISNIVRIGPPSASSHIEALSLDARKREPGPRVGGVNRIKDESRGALLTLTSKIKCLLETAGRDINSLIMGFLRKKFPSQASMINLGPCEKDGEAMQEWASGDVPRWNEDGTAERSIEELLKSDMDLWTLHNAERARILQYWQDTAWTELSVGLSRLLKFHHEEKRKHTSAFGLLDLQRLNSSQVVGITTTQLANNADLLRNINSKVLICEEAGEVLESHVITALLPSVQHAILIGDHLQLRPRISNIRLSKACDETNFNLDESLFERLATYRFGDLNAEEQGFGFPVAQLSHQRRMHSVVSDLVRDTFYPNLKDHPVTAAYPPISGLKRRLFWLDHRNIEDPTDPADPMQSKTNAWEAGMVVALVRHLTRQGKYGPGEIAVLTPYVGQLRMLEDILGREMALIISETDKDDLDEEDVEAPVSIPTGPSRSRNLQGNVHKGSLLDVIRLSTVDNFQGEEATVVVVSLVRSNRYRNCGFLDLPNRINVLLSRAKHGMYIIGDANTASTAPMWSSVIGILERDANIGPKLELHCSRHPGIQSYISQPDDFAVYAPEGGCADKCELRLACGHRCPVKCHSEKLHKAVKCMEPCTRVKGCGHACPKKCHERCGDCQETVLNVLLPCGHRAQRVECRMMGNLKNIRCVEQLVRTISGCSHRLKVRCFENASSMKCFHLCGNVLPCGHNCRKPCWQCRSTMAGKSTIDHGVCHNPCGRPFTTCAHVCNQPCHQGTACAPCDRTCEVRCKHSRCAKNCSEPCAPCAEPCGWGCDHRKKCALPCAVPCSKVPCNLRCKKKLWRCGHRCPGMCGEPCPDSAYCRLCCNQGVLTRNVDLLEFKAYKDINIDQDPLIFLSCGHFYTSTSLDGVMSMSEYYDMDQLTGIIIRPKVSYRAMSSGDVKGCPECRMPLRNINRYNRIIKKGLLDEATKRFVSHTNSIYAGLMEAIRKRETDIEKERVQFMSNWPLDDLGSKGPDQVQRSIEAYRAKGNRLQRQIKEFTKSVGREEQPFGRVNNMLAAAAARDQSIVTTSFPFDESIIQTGFESRGEILGLRLTWALFWDLDAIYTRKDTDPRIRATLVQVVASQLERILKRCHELAEASQTARFPQQEVESRIYHVLFTMLSLSNSDAQGKVVDIPTQTAIRDKAREELKACEEICLRHRRILSSLHEDIEKAKTLVNGGMFYSFVSTDEKRQVYRAMEQQFAGTGHWYYCENNHPFTVGECGMPMEQARCPQCEAPVGGLNHELAPGMRRADDIDVEFGGTSRN